MIARIPVELVDPPPVAKPKIKILSTDQVGALLRHLDGRSLRPIV